MGFPTLPGLIRPNCEDDGMKGELRSMTPFSSPFFILPRSPEPALKSCTPGNGVIAVGGVKY